MLELDVPKVESLHAVPRDGGKRRFVLVTMPGSDPFDLFQFLRHRGFECRFEEWNLNFVKRWHTTVRPFPLG